MTWFSRLPFLRCIHVVSFNADRSCSLCCQRFQLFGGSSLQHMTFMNVLQHNSYTTTSSHMKYVKADFANKVSSITWPSADSPVDIITVLY